MLRIYAPEEEQALFELEEARAWRRSELISKEQLDAVELSAGKTLSLAGKAVRLLFAGFTLLALGAASGFVGSCIGHEKTSMGAFFLLSAPAYVLLAEHLIRRYRLYRFGAEEGLLMGAAIQLAVGTYLVFASGLDPYARQGSEILFTLPFLMSTLALYVRYGYAYAGIAAVFALGQLIVYQGLEPHHARLTLSGSFVAVLAALRMREVPEYERERWDMLDACLCLAVYLPLNLRLDSFLNPFGQAPRLGEMGHFYWGTLAVVWLIPPAVLLWGARARKRAVLIIGAILALLSLMTLKPYLGIQRNPWDPAVLGVFLMALGWILSRKLDAFPGWTAKPLLIPREELSAGSLLAAAAAAAAAPSRAGAPGAEPRFGGGESGGAGATASF